MGLSSADTGQASCTAPAPEEAPDNGDDSVTTHTRVTQQCRQWKPEGEGNGNWGLPQMEQESYKAGKSGDFYRADGREESGQRTKVSSNREFRLLLRQDLLALEPASGGPGCL